MRNRPGVHEVAVVLLFLAVPVCHAETQQYDYRESADYRALDAGQRAKLDQVAKDMQSLEAAIKQHMLDHDGRAPETLAALVPRYLPQLPRDPFYVTESESDEPDDHYQASLSGAGYRYRRRVGPTMVESWEPLTFYSLEDAWQIKSVGLPDFPFRYSARSRNGRG